MQIKDAIISHGCFLRECTVKHSIVGERSRLDYGVELKVSYSFFSYFLPFVRYFVDGLIDCDFSLQDSVMMGADYYQTESEIASLLAEGKVPIGIGRNTKIR